MECWNVQLGRREWPQGYLRVGTRQRLSVERDHMHDGGRGGALGHFAVGEGQRVSLERSNMYGSG